MSTANNAMSVTPITRLELHSEPVPRGPIIERLEREIGRPLTHQTRHYLAGEPIHCGDILELCVDGTWIRGRYEWTGKPADLPTFAHDGRVRRITADCLVRWPL
jgi:hypothetical protein